MNPERDRRLLDAAARGVEALLRAHEERVSTIPRERARDKAVVDARRKLSGVLDGGDRAPTMSFIVPPPEVPQLQKRVAELEKENAELKARLRAIESIKADVLYVIRNATTRGDGRTVDEIECALGLSHQTASARVYDLAKAGLIKRSGKRKTRSGKAAAVWFAKE